ncbi:dual specificity mitogen-activated protein kinase kinase 1 [Pyrenophora tritici-repentis]|nr:dual specificity mitogen-activated protein kinase kinase 1 [Pyrenophora tritici-repentis]
MDHQGAGFAFDPNMDFPAFKSVDDTAGFFYGDEAIDTSAIATAASSFAPAMFDTQSSFDMQHSLSLDDTSVTPAWNTQLTPHMQPATNSFLSTPMQSFNSMPGEFNALGKRPLQLEETHEYPQAKRHAGFDFPLFPTPSTAIDSWSMEPTPPSTSSEGLTDEAADVCSIWFNKYNVLPSDKHIDSLSQLTGESEEAIRNWFGRLVKQGMDGSQSDSAYKSQTFLIQQQPLDNTFWHDPTYQTELTQVSPPQINISPEMSPSLDDVATTTVQSVTTSRGNKKRCTPTDDVELLRRDPQKIYQCTRKCGKRYGRKNDWKRNEEEGYPCKSWVCSLCTSEGVEHVKPCYRKYHFVQHFRNIHSGMNPEDYDEASTVYSETEFPRKCGFCRHRFESRQERIDHIANHFKQGNSKYFGNNGGSSGSSGQQPQGGFFQFQLSQLGESQLYCADRPTKPITLSPNISQSSTSPESNGIVSQGERVQTEDNDATTLARDAIAQPIKEEYESSSLGRLAEHPHWKYSRASTEPEEPLLGARLLNFPTRSEEGLSAGRDTQCPESSTEIIPRGRSPVGLHIPQIPKKSRSFLSVKLLGAGGFSTVDEVIHQQTGLHVVRKTLKNRDRTALEELKKEVSVLQKLRHPHIIRLIGAYSKGDKMSILISPVAETTLAGWLERPLSKRPATLLHTVVKMFGCLASSVRYIHEQRPVVKHMDIKPQNILIVGSDQEIPHVILCDFGVSSAEDPHDHGSKPLTRQYVAPEVFEGFVRKQAADIWSLGCVFSEMASLPLSQDNTDWTAFRKEFSGRSGKYYWQDVPGVQQKLSSFLDAAKNATEQTVVRTIQSMMDANPDNRPDAASLTLVFTPAPCCLNWPNDKATFPGPDEEHGGIEAFAHEDIFEQYSHDRDPTPYSDSLLSAKTWLQDCLHTHDACHHVPTSEFSALPTRLIDMLPDGQSGPYVRIVESDMLQPTTEQVEYVALSHVWDFNQPVLSSSSLPDMQNELDLQKLPNTVRQGISAAQRLGYRYCWLDALCVLQDSWQQKERECKSMSLTFRNAALTVNTEIGFSGTTPHPAPSLFKVIAGETTSTVRLPASAMLPSSILASPNFSWDTRAWVLQDRLLSRRFLHLGKQLYWECNTLKASETFPCGLSPLVWEKLHTLQSSPPDSISRRRRTVNLATADYHATAAIQDSLALSGADRPPQFNYPLFNWQDGDWSAPTPTPDTVTPAASSIPPHLRLHVRRGIPTNKRTFATAPPSDAPMDHETHFSGLHVRGRSKMLPHRVLSALVWVVGN